MDLFKILFKRIVYKIPIKILFIISILAFLLFFCIGCDVFAVQQVGTESDYGYYVWYNENGQINNINSFIDTYKGDYDSFMAFTRNYNYVAFYNFDDTGYACTWVPQYSSSSDFAFQYGLPDDCVIYKTNGTFTSIQDTYTSFSNIQFNMDRSAFKVYTNRNIYDGQNNFTNLWLESSNVSIQGGAEFVFDISLSTINNTTQPIYCQTAWNDISLAQTYECYISTNSSNWYLMQYETLTDNGVTSFRFKYPIVKNDTYYFKVYNKDTDESTYYSLQVTNIISNGIVNGFNDDGVPQPILYFKKVDNNFIVYTQYFNYEYLTSLNCYFTNDTTNTNYSTWSTCSIGSYYDTTYNTDLYYFFTTIPTDSTNLTLSFVFYDYETNSYGYPSSITCDINGMTDYHNAITQVINNDTESGQWFQGFIVRDNTGIDALFDKLYDAFCTDEVVDLTATIPFTNQSFRISSESISSFYPESIKSFVNLFFWGIISLFIIKDIRTMIDKIAQGNVEHVSSDVKKEVL